MNAPGYHTRSEILSQPEAWSAALEALRAQVDSLRHLYRAGRYDTLLFTGCGSTYYLALAAAAQVQAATCVPACGLPASEVWLNQGAACALKGKVLLVAISRSGETTETLRACDAFRAGGHGDVLTLSCSPGCALAQLGSHNLVLPSGQEESVVQTRAFSTLYLATLALAGIWSERVGWLDELTLVPRVGRRLMTDHASLARSLGADATRDRFYILGSGPRYGLACELSLKIKEMSLTHSEPFHFLEFRHGPKSMVTPSTLVVGLVSESDREREGSVLEEMRALGAQTLALGENRVDVAFESALSEAAYQVLYLPIGQLLALERALSKGLNPDRPSNLQAVVILT